MNNLSGDDFVYYKENGKVMSGGFDINSILMKQGTSPLVSLNNDDEAQTGGSLNPVSNLFKSLAVPTGLLYLHEKKKGYKNLEYAQSGGKKQTAKKVKILSDKKVIEDVDVDDDNSSTSSSSSASSSSSSSDSDSDSDSSENLENDAILNEAVFQKCLDIVSRLEIAKQKVEKVEKVEKRKSRKNNKAEKPVKKKASRKNKK